MKRTMQTLPPDSFCPLTNPQPYQRDQDELRRAAPRIAAGKGKEVITQLVITPARRRLHRLVRRLNAYLMRAAKLRCRSFPF